MTVKVMKTVKSKNSKSKSKRIGPGRPKSKPGIAANPKKSKSKVKATKAASSGRGYRLTISESKVAVLLRLPKDAIEAIDLMASGTLGSRTGIIYGLLAASPLLKNSMREYAGVRQMETKMVSEAVKEAAIDGVGVEQWDGSIYPSYGQDPRRVERVVSEALTELLMAEPDPDNQEVLGMGTEQQGQEQGQDQGQEVVDREEQHEHEHELEQQ